MANYRYIGKDDLQFDDANDEYSLVFVMGDRFNMYRHGQTYVVHHDASKEITFKLTLKEGKALERMSEESLTVTPDVENPPYMLFQPKFEMVPLLYDYFNRTYFNGACPVVKFVKSNKASIWGMAQANWVRGKLVYTFHINESTMIDRVLFTNTILHEMIHLFNYATGEKLLATDQEKAMEHIHANHGPLFIKEMMRLNGKGFHIIKEGTHEEFQRKATEEFFAIIAKEQVKGRTMRYNAWYTHKPLGRPDMERLAAQLSDEFPHASFEIQLLETKDRTITNGGHHLKDNKTFSALTIKKFLAGAPEFESWVRDTMYVQPSVNVILPEFKDMPETYALPFNTFVRAMRTYTSDHMALKNKWKKFPKRLLAPQVQVKFQTLVNRMKRGSASDADIVNTLNDLLMMYDERYPFDVYQKDMKDLIKEYDRKGLLVPYAKIMRLIA